MKSSLITSLFAAGCAAHSTFQKVYVNGVDQGQYFGIRAVQANNPIMDVTLADIACNSNTNYFKTPYPPTSSIAVKAGDTVTTEWHHGNGPAPSDGDDPIASSHLGPTIAYLAKIPSFGQTDATSLKWFKIFQDGLDSSGKWGVNRLISSGGKFSFKIPSCIAAGTYLLRAEIIALHAAGSYPGAQFYTECAQIVVSGGGSKVPATVSFPGAYKGSDPGITFNLYGGAKSYTVPGPAVFTC